MQAIKTTHRGYLPFKHLSNDALTTNILPSLKSASLVSLGQLCDDNCTVALHKNKIEVFKNKVKLLQGPRNMHDGLWDIHIPTQIQHKNNIQRLSVIIQKSTTKRDLVQFYHAAMFSPAISTFYKAVKNGNFQTWPGLTPELITKYLQPTVATHYGHMKQERQNLQSTQQSTNFDFFPSPEEPNIQTNELMATITPYQINQKAFGDLPGKFPYTSSRGAQYFLVLYHYDSNAILIHTLKNRTAQEIKNGYMSLYEMLKARGNAPKTFILDNETSSLLLNAFEKENLQYQLVPPHMHRRNAAEKAIQTWKQHFISGLSSVHPQFPLLEWDRLTFQGMMTLNLLRNSRVNPKLSAWEYLFGRYNFNATPIAPPGMKMVVHQKPTQRASWDPHGIIAFYVGPAMKHYRCFKCFVPSTKSERISDTVTFLPHNDIKVPATTPEEGIRQALKDIFQLLQTPQTNLPFTTMGDETKEAIKKVQDIFETKVRNNQNDNYKQQSVEFFTKNIPNRHKLPPPTNLPIWPANQTSITEPPRVTGHQSLQNITQKYTNWQPLYPAVNHIYNAEGKRQTLDKLRASNQKDIWEKALSNEWGRLAQGNDHGVVPTNTISFIHRHEVPMDRDVTYASFVCDHRPLKTEPWRV